MELFALSYLLVARPCIYIYRIPEFQEQAWIPKWQFTSYVLVPKWWIYSRFTVSHSFFLETQLDTMVFVGHGQTTPCKEMGPLPTQGLICWWFHGSMLLQPQGVSDKTNMNQEDSGSTYSNKCLGMDSHCFTYHIANGGINSKQTSFHQGQPSHRWNKRTCVCFF